jgi:hypothetical protein
MTAGSAIAALAAAALLLGGCGTSRLFGEYEVPESEGVASAEWPRLVDTPLPPARGTFAQGYPDPAIGVAITADLTAIASAAAARADILAQPVLTAADLQRLAR